MSNHLKKVNVNALIRKIRMGPIMSSWYEFQQEPREVASPNTDYLRQQQNDLNQLNTFLREMDKCGRSIKLYDDNENPDDGYPEELNRMHN